MEYIIKHEEQFDIICKCITNFEKYKFQYIKNIIGQKNDSPFYKIITINFVDDIKLTFEYKNDFNGNYVTIYCIEKQKNTTFYAFPYHYLNDIHEIITAEFEPDESYYDILYIIKTISVQSEKIIYNILNKMKNCLKTKRERNNINLSYCQNLLDIIHKHNVMNNTSIWETELIYNDCSYNFEMVKVENFIYRIYVMFPDKKKICLLETINFINLSKDNIIQIIKANIDDINNNITSPKIGDSFLLNCILQ